MAAREYKVILHQEGMPGSLLRGQSKVDPERFSTCLNRHADDGRRVVMMGSEAWRTPLLRGARGIRGGSRTRRAGKSGRISALGVLVATGLLCVVHPWLPLFSGAVFFDLLPTSAVALLVIGVLALVRHESGKAQRQRRDGYLD